MAVARDALPIAPADVQPHAVHQPAEAPRHLAHHAGVVVGTRAQFRQRRVVGHAVAGIEGGRMLAAVRVADGAAGHARGVPVGGADPQPAAEAFGEPVRQADVIGVHVGADHAQHRQTLQLGGEHLLPGGAGLGVVDAAIDDGPALAPAGGRVFMVAQQPQVDVVQRKGQPHAQPAHAVGNVQHLPGLRQRVAEGIVQFAFEGIGHRGQGSSNGGQSIQHQGCGAAVCATRHATCRATAVLPTLAPWMPTSMPCSTTTAAGHSRPSSASRASSPGWRSSRARATCGSAVPTAACRRTRSPAWTRARCSCTAMSPTWWCTRT